MTTPMSENATDGIMAAAVVLLIVEGKSTNTNEFQIDIEYDTFGKKSQILHYNDRFSSEYNMDESINQETHRICSKTKI
jgi:hypothetical protein